MTLKLGLKPVRPGSIRLRFRDYFKTVALPPVPAIYGYGERLLHAQRINDWGMLANDSVGDCVIAGAAHETMLFRADAGGSVRFDNAAVLSDYSAITGYDPADPSTDQGTDMEAAAKYRRQTGVVDADGVRHKIDVYADLDAASLGLAVFLFGAVGVGVSITQSAMDEVEQGMAWNAVGGKTLGGHYIPCVGRNSAGNWLFVTWGRLQAATPRWLGAHMQGAIAYISRERLDGKGLSPQGYDAAALNDDFAQVTA